MITAIAILCSLIAITYLVYPICAIAYAAILEEKIPEASTAERRVFLFMAAHNEAAVISKSLENLMETTFPGEKLICYIGSDASTDDTNTIISQFMERLKIHFVAFKQRQGKPSIINQLVAKARKDYQMNGEDLFLLVDANIVLDPEYISNLSCAFDDPQLGLADGALQEVKNVSGVAGSERQYLQLETKLKRAEGKIWGCSMGPFGGAYMIRQELFQPVPQNFLVDDFFIFYHILKEGFKSRVVSTATYFEEASGDLAEEFRRKERISTGNFQNTAFYFTEMMRFWKVHNLVFFLHKLLRWLSPVFIICILILLGLMASGNPIAGYALLIMISLLVGLPLLNNLLKQLNLSVGWLQAISYLIIMNAALLSGFFKFLKGVRTNVWEPTKRSA